MNDTITLSRAIIEDTIHALERYAVKRQDFERFETELAMLKAALAAPQPKTTCATCRTPNSCSGDGLCLEEYIASRLEAQPAPLTDAEIDSLAFAQFRAPVLPAIRTFARAVEAAILNNTTKEIK